MAITKWSIKAPSSKKSPRGSYAVAPGKGAVRQNRALRTSQKPSAAHRAQCQKRVLIEAGHSDSFDQPPSPRRAPGGMHRTQFHKRKNPNKKQR
jgi:hypothetical protein